MRSRGRKQPAPARPPVTWWTYTWGDYVTALVWGLPLSLALVAVTRGFDLALVWTLASGVAWIVLVIAFAKVWEAWRSRRRTTRSSEHRPALPEPSPGLPARDDAMTVGEILVLMLMCLCAVAGGFVGLFSTGSGVAMVAGAAVYGVVSLLVVVAVSFALSGLAWLFSRLIGR